MVIYKTPYKEGCVLDLVLSPLYWLVLVINYITFNTQITFDSLCMLSEIWCASLKATYAKENVNLCLFLLHLSVTTLTPHYTGCLLKPSHPHTTFILIFTHLHLNNIFFLGGQNRLFFFFYHILWVYKAFLNKQPKLETTEKVRR